MSNMTAMRTSRAEIFMDVFAVIITGPTTIPCHGAAVAADEPSAHAARLKRSPCLFHEKSSGKCLALPINLQPLLRRMFEKSARSEHRMQDSASHAGGKPCAPPCQPDRVSR
jgi:hypothetical protein